MPFFYPKRVFSPYSNAAFCMGRHRQGSLHLSPTQPHPPPPSSPTNTVRRGVWKKGRIALGRGKPLRWLVILVLLTSCEVDSPIGNKVDHTSTSPITFGKWNSQTELCRHWTPDAPIRTTAPIERSPGLSPYVEALEVAMVSGVPKKHLWGASFQAMHR